ncbi:MAG: DUF2585 family protein [Candidatus Paceibacterota bacterium]|jgi:hypothetical protein
MNFFKKYRVIIFSTFIILLIVGITEFIFGRSPFGPDGKIALWDGNIWSSENSQRIADPYTFSHIAHGLIFYGFLWLVTRKIPVKYRFILAVIIESTWEILENSPLIINRYREATIAQGYVGDSILNSLSDIVWMSLAFIFASRTKVWICVLLIVVMELGCAYFVRDNLTLNIIMFIHPFEAIKNWQMLGQPIL